MHRFLSVFVAILSLAVPAAAGEETLSGHWKFSLHERNTQTTFWLLHLEAKDGKLAGAADNVRGAPKANIEQIKLVGDAFTISLKATIEGPMGGKREITFDFEGRLPKAGAKKIYGSFSDGNNVLPALLESSSAKNIFELDRETLTRTPSDPRAFLAIFDVIDKSKDHKVSAKDLGEWVEGSLKSAEQYGPRFQQQHQTRLLESLSGQKDYLPVAVDVAKKVSKQLDPKTPAETQLQVLTTIADVFRSAKQKDELAALETRLEKLETNAYTEYMKKGLDFKTPKFTGRKAKSNRAVLVELFTGAQCPPCVAADLAFDGLAKTYDAKDVVLLQYHMHIPRPEPMSAPAGEARFDFYAETYAKQVRGTPTILFNGKPEGAGGGYRDDAPERYKEFTDVVNRKLEDPAKVQITATAARKGDTIAILAKVTDAEKPGEKLRLRLVLVEDWVRYKGVNGLQYHHRVVRAMPGGPRGAAIKDKTLEHAASIDLTELRTELNKFLDDAYEGPRPMRLRDLHVVAFVQNDDTAEILHAIDVPVKVEK